MNGMLKRMCLILFLVSGLVSIAAGADAPAPKPEEDFDLLMTYYRAPAPEKIDATLKSLDAVPFKPSALSPILGFFYEVFRANPDRVPGWLETIKKFRQTGLKVNLQAMAVVAVPGTRRPLALVLAKLPTPEELERAMATVPDFNWGRFFATGDAKHVDAVLRYALTAKDKGDTIHIMAYAARWSLFALSRQQTEVEKIFRELLTKCSDDEVKFLFDTVEVPERERLLGRERAAKLPPPVKEKSKRAALKNPFKGLFKEWKNRPNPNDAVRILLDKYIAELVPIYPASNPADIRKFLVWFCLGRSKNYPAGMKKSPCADPWAEAVRISQLYDAAAESGATVAAAVPATINALTVAAAVRANRELADGLPFGDLLRMELLRLLHNAKAPGSEEQAALDREVVAEIEAVILKGERHNAITYQWLYNLLANSNSCGRRYWIELEERLKPHAAKLDPWFWEMAQGRAGISAAWEGRGDGWGSTVTEEGWDVFGENLAKARRHFTRAIELFPERYNAHIRLITIEMGSGSTDALIEVFKKIAWYDASNESAWNAVLWGLRPRWCGSLELIRMLAVEAMDCPRRDVGVAELGYQALGTISSESGMRWQNPYRDPEARKLADRLFAEYEKRAKTPEARRIFLWRKFCREMVLGEYDLAAKTFREYGGAERFAKNRRWQWGAWFPSKIGTSMYDDPVMRLKTFTGRHAAALREAENIFLSGEDDRAALEKLVGIIRGGDLPPDEKEFLIDLYGRWRLDCKPSYFCLRGGKYMSAYLVALRHDRSDVAAEMEKLGYRPKEKNPGDIIANIVLEGKNTDEILRRHAAGENVNIVRKEDGFSSLHMAARYGNAEMAETLLKCGAKIDCRNNNGHTPLHLAATFKEGPTVRVLLKYGADPNEQDNEGDFCLLYLPQVHALSDMYKIFLAHPKINVNLQNHAGETALHYMAKCGAPAKVVKLLIDAGADCNVRDCNGRTPLDVAESNKHTETAEFLRSVGGKRGPELPPPPPPPFDWSNVPFEYWYCGGVGVVIVLLIAVAAALKIRKKRMEK